LDDAIERLNPDASPQYLYRGPSNTADVEDDLRLVIAAARERDALAAVIEEAREASEHTMHPDQTTDRCGVCRMSSILSRTPSDVLAERDARIRAEVIDWIAGESDFSFEFVAAAREHFGLTKGADRG
jgi:hypothetical protein